MARDNTLTESLDLSLERVRRGDFAFFIESPRLDYEVGRDCDLVQVGQLLNSRYYCIGLQPGKNDFLVDRSVK